MAAEDEPEKGKSEPEREHFEGVDHGLQLKPSTEADHTCQPSRFGTLWWRFHPETSLLRTFATGWAKRMARTATRLRIVERFQVDW